MLRRFLLAALCALSAASAGCGTLANQSGSELYITCAWSPPSEPYGGVERDWHQMRWDCSRVADEGPDTGSVVGLALAILDLPLSAVGDTVLLPYDVWVTMTRRPEHQDADRSGGEK
jgi:uncharacterized protein YceK